MGLDPATAGSFFDHPRINTSHRKVPVLSRPAAWLLYCAFVVSTDNRFGL